MCSNEKSIPPFSVLIPFYNGDDLNLFKSALLSIIENTWSAAEILLLVDGPICAKKTKYLSTLNYKNLKILYFEKNEGLATTLNKGIEVAKNEIIVRADADDINVPTRFQVLVKYFVENNLDLLGSQIKEIDPLGRSQIRRVPLNKDEIIRFIRYRNPFNHMSVAFKKSVVQEMGGYPVLHYREDYGLWLKFVGQNRNIQNIEDVLVQATIGREHLKRRAGFKYILGEWSLMLHKMHCGIRIDQAILSTFIRIAAFSTPISLKKKIFNALRQS